ncbi:acyl-CoA dehydrogenase family protein [Salinispira pacifica]|nr:acyl-CoA dehydrogenase family protein [Salinispira pacifica]
MSKASSTSSKSEKTDTTSAPAGETHRVFNQPGPLDPYNAYRADTPLQEWVQRFSARWFEGELHDYGARVGGDLVQAGFHANSNPPVFHSHDRFGHRIDEVRYHDSYHELMKTAIEAMHPALPWAKPQPGSHVARAALAYLHTQADPGSGCPLTMTFASVPALKHQPDIASLWLPKITAPHYNPDNIPYFEKSGVTIGMAMTEKQGGSDVQANTTTARPLGGEGGGKEYAVTGHKWFCSAPMCDAFMVLAHTPASRESGSAGSGRGTLSCFLMPRWKPDGSKNSMFFQRIKNKMGNVSNASGEVEFRDAFAWMIGEPGRGVPTIIQMVSMTRFDCMIGSAAIMRQALSQAFHHTAGRNAFGRNLHQQPLMRNVLADLAVESEAALAVTMRCAHSLDLQQSGEMSPREKKYARLATALGKYWICKRSAGFTAECMESIGGVGVVEDNMLPRLYRESPVNAIWEGSGNIQCLDVLRAIDRDPEVLAVFLGELKHPIGYSAGFDSFLRELEEEFSTAANTKRETLELKARYLTEKLVLAWQASTLIQYGDPHVAEAFVESRIHRTPMQQYGTLPGHIELQPILDRVLNRDQP